MATDETDNDTTRFWCSGATVYGDGDYGTPKTANIDCANLDYDGDGLTLEDGDCDDENSAAGIQRLPKSAMERTMIVMDIQMKKMLIWCIRQMISGILIKMVMVMVLLQFGMCTPVSNRLAMIRM